MVPLLLVMCCGVLLTLSGLLSKRVVLPHQSNHPPSPDAALVDQVVLVLVDAMRPDFVFPGLRRFASRGGLCNVDIAEQAGPTYNGPSLTYLEETLKRAEEGRSTDISQLAKNGAAAPIKVMTPLDRPSALGMFLVADAPTTTAQRLKALSTGVIPAFVEAGANFNSDVVSDDSLIVQARRLTAARMGTSLGGGGASILGDDTWVSLFPEGMWKAAKVFSSFDVRDLDSNDKGVESYLGDLLESEAPSDPAASPLLIAHFLGVDHAGHRFNAQNEHMDRKITEIDASLRGLSTMLSRRAHRTGSSTMLVVLGDHGMTNSGDHGGNAPQETDTMLFAQLFRGGDTSPSSSSPSPGSASAAIRSLQKERREMSCNNRGAVDGDLCRLWACGDVAMSSRDDTGASIPSVEGMGAAYQIDVVPTISTLLGMAIPYSNIGRVIPEVVSLAGGSEEAIISALLANRDQMDSYQTATGNTHPVRDGVASNRTSLIRDQAMMASEVRNSRTHIKVHRIWIGVVGMLVFLLMLSMRALVSSCIPNPMRIKKMGGRSVGRPLWPVVVCCISTLLLGWYTMGSGGGDMGGDHIDEGIVLSILMLAVVISASIAEGVVTHRWVFQLWHNITASTKTAIPTVMVLVLVLIRMIVPLSNSFVVFEDRIITWLLPLTLAALATVSTTPVSTPTWRSGIVLCVVLRLLSMSIRSRRHHTHVMDDLSPLDAWMDTMLSMPSGSGFLDAHPLPTSLLSGSHISAALMAATLRLACNIAAASGGGRFSYVGVLVFTLCEGTPIIHHLIPFVFIGYCIYYKGNHASYSGLAPWGLLWGASLCTGLSARVAASCIGWLGCTMASILEPTLSTPNITAPQMLLCAFAVHLLGWECFFHSGLQTTISSLDWNAAFVGVPSYNMTLCGLLSICRTAFPHMAVSTMVFSRLSRRRIDDPTKRHLINMYALLQSVAVAFSCCACGVHMVHLMMWTIFCPKALFDAAIWAVTITQAVIVQYLLV